MIDKPTFREYGAVVIRECLGKMLLHVEGVLVGETVEPVHKMRVASRRLRAALSVFAPAFPSNSFTKFENEIKLVTDALGAARDLDVMVGNLETLEHSLAESDRSMLEAFIQIQVAQRGKRQKQVQSALGRIEKLDLSEQWEKIVLAGQPKIDVVDVEEEEQTVPNQVREKMQDNSDVNLDAAIHAILMDPQIMERTKQ